MRPPEPISRFALCAALGVAWGCATAPRAVTHEPLPAEIAAYLVDPSALASPELAGDLASVYRRLRAGATVDLLRSEVDGYLPGAEDAAVVELLRAQIEFAVGELDAAERRLSPLGPAVAGSAAARLLAARLAELDGRAMDAFLLYDGLATDEPLARERREAIRDAAARSAESAIGQALAAGEADRARRELERLERAAPRGTGTLKLAARVASARGDRRAELDALRALAAGGGSDRRLDLRRGELEIQVGEASAGLALLDRLVASQPDDPEAVATLARGRFLFGLANAPEAVRSASRRRELTRADFARLLYWLAPSVRAARPPAVRIAADSFDHPARDEIVRVVNLGLMRLDEALHAFEPDRLLARSDAFLALARLRGLDVAARAEGCAFALAEGWIEAHGSCLPAATVSGEEAVDWLRRSRAGGGEG